MNVKALCVDVTAVQLLTDDAGLSSIKSSVYIKCIIISVINLKFLRIRFR